MWLVTFDLDDTLMACGMDYDDAAREFGRYASDSLGCSTEAAEATLNDCDSENIAEYGLSMERYPQSFVDAFQRLSEETPGETDLEHVRGIGERTFKSAAEYAERGFMDGAEAILKALADEPIALHLITAGDPRSQQPKIDGLGLERYFDDTHIVPIDSKHETLQRLMDDHGIDASHTIHVGNSLTSDVKPALKVGGHAIYLPTHEWRAVEDADYYREHERVTIYDTPAALAADAPDIFYELTATPHAD